MRLAWNIFTDPLVLRILDERLRLFTAACSRFAEDGLAATDRGGHGVCTRDETSASSKECYRWLMNAKSRLRRGWLRAAAVSLAVWAGQDHAAPANVQDAYRAIASRIKNLVLHIFPGIQHGFMLRDAGPAFDQKTRDFAMSRANAILEGLRGTTTLREAS